MLTSPQKELLKKKKRVEKRKRTKKKPPENHEPEDSFCGSCPQPLTYLTQSPTLESGKFLLLR
jgi:hypothetical protein